MRRAWACQIERVGVCVRHCGAVCARVPGCESASPQCAAAASSPARTGLSARSGQSRTVNSRGVSSRSHAHRGRAGTHVGDLVHRLASPRAPVPPLGVQHEDAHLLRPRLPNGLLLLRLLLREALHALSLGQRAFRGLVGACGSDGRAPSLPHASTVLSGRNAGEVPPVPSVLASQLLPPHDVPPGSQGPFARTLARLRRPAGAVLSLHALGRRGQLLLSLLLCAVLALPLHSLLLKHPLAIVAALAATTSRAARCRRRRQQHAVACAPAFHAEEAARRGDGAVHRRLRGGGGGGADRGLALHRP